MYMYMYIHVAPITGLHNHSSLLLVTKIIIKGTCTIQRFAHAHNISVYMYFRIYHRKIMTVVCKLTLPDLLYI